MNSGSDDHTPNISKQGRITTQNPQLLSLLRENSAASVRNLSPPTKSNRTPITSAGRMSTKQKNDKESEIKSAQAVGSNSPVGNGPEHSHGSPLRSRRLSPAVGGDSVGERGYQLEDSLVDSLEVDNRAEVERSNSGADADGRYFLQDSLEPAVFPANPKLASNKAANVSEQLTSDKIFENNDGHRFVDSNNISNNSYSARRLKGTDSSQRILLPTKDTLSSEKIVSRASSKQSNATPEKDQVSDNFTDTVKLDIRQMLENGTEQIGYVRNNTNNSARRHSAGKTEKFHPEAPAMAQDEADRMYVDSPTFTPQEEEEYRFVSSRLEDQEDFKDNATYRELDQNALKGDSDVAYSKTQARKQYVMRPSASSKRPSVDIPGEKHPAQRQPEIPLTAVEDSLEVSTEDSDLERERNYQNALQERLQQQALTDADIHIPRLNLPNESVDLVRHSFEDEDTYRDTEQAEDDFAVQDNGQWVHQPPNPYQYQPQPIHQHEQYRQPEYSSGMPPQHYQEHYQQQGYFPPGPQQHQQQHSHQVDYQYGGPQPENMYGPSEPPYEQYDNVDPNFQQQYPDDQYEYSQEGHDNEGDPQQFYPPQLQSGQGLARYPTQTEAEYFIELPTKDDQSPRRDIDYIEKNKQNVNRTKQGRSYGDLNKKKSEIAQQHASKLGQNSQRKTPAVNTKRVRNEIQTEDMDQPNGNAEQVWQNRAAHLANKKQGSGKAKSRKVGKLQKYPTESKIKTQVGKNIPDVPDNIARHEANADRGALSTGDLSPSRRPLVLKPITQEVWTEDGQRISVDINLKLMSPPPAPGQQIALGRQNPLGPIPQGGPQLIAHQMAHASYPRAGAQLQQEQQLDQPYFGQQQATHYQQPIQAYPDTPHQHGFPVQGEFEKFKKHQHNVEQQELMQQQMYQQQLARKQELQQQLQNLQLEEQGYSTDSSVPLYQQQFPDEDMYDGAYPTPRGEDFNMGTPRRSRPAQRGRSGVNPYARIPPIPAHAQPKEAPEGYVNQFHDRKQKEQRRPDYKVYTLNDYRKMQKEVRLGGLGPDLDNETYKDRASKKIRQENYARAVMMKNKQVPQGRPPPNPRPQETDMLPKTYVAREYAKSIPKPKVRPVENEYNSYEVSAQLSPSSTRKNVSSTRNFSGPSTRNTAGPAKLPPTPTKNIDVIDLQKLHERHQRDKQNVALMRQNMEIL